MGLINENGEMFLDFCTQNRLMIGGSVFPHKTIHKVTWISPGGETKNQIDHITIEKRWRHSLLDVRAMRGADIGSDHILVRGRMKIKLARTRKNKDIQREKYNTQWLRENSTSLEQFKRKLRENATEIQDTEECTIEELWSKCKGVYKDTAKEVLGLYKETNKPWISRET